MKISHDGERCYHVDDQLQAVPFHADVSDDALHALIDDLVSWEKERVAQALQPVPLDVEQEVVGHVLLVPDRFVVWYWAGEHAG